MLGEAAGRGGRRVTSDGHESWARVLTMLARAVDCVWLRWQHTVLPAGRRQHEGDTPRGYPKYTAQPVCTHMLVLREIGLRALWVWRQGVDGASGVEGDLDIEDQDWRVARCRRPPRYPFPSMSELCEINTMCVCACVRVRACVYASKRAYARVHSGQRH